MKILIAQSNNPNVTNHFMGIAQALAKCEHNVSVWHRNAKPTFDIFDEFEPNLLILDSSSYDQSIVKCLNNRPFCQVAVFGKSDERYDAECSIISGPNTIKIAANILSYDKPQTNDKFLCEIGYIGRHHPILDSLWASGYNLKFFGEKTRNEYSLGNIRPGSIQDVFYNCSKFLHIYENESSQQIYDAIFCMAEVISDIGYETKVFGKDCPYITWVQDLYNADFMTCTDEECSIGPDYELRQEGREWIFKYHTYFDRVIDLFNILDIDTKSIEEGKMQYEKQRL